MKIKLNFFYLLVAGVCWLSTALSVQAADDDWWYTNYDSGAVVADGSVNSAADTPVQATQMPISGSLLPTLVLFGSGLVFITVAFKKEFSSKRIL
jgi:hypothetical protein